MNNPFRSAKDFISRYKKEEWFRAVAVIVIVTALAAVGLVTDSGMRTKKIRPNSLRLNRRKNLYLKIYGMTARCILLCLLLLPLLSAFMRIFGIAENWMSVMKHKIL